MKVLYIIGWGRSGSTILDNLLGGIDGFFSGGEIRNLWKEGLIERRVCGCGRPVDECPVWSSVLERVETRLSRKLDPRVMIDHEQSGARARHTWSILRHMRRNTLNGRAAAYRDIMREVYLATLEVTGARVLVDSSKVPAQAALLASMSGLEAHYLHLVRDPRASAYSWLRHKARKDLDESEEMPRFGLVHNGLSWLEFNLGAQTIRRKAGVRSFTLLRYEDFIAEPRAAISRIVRAIGESPAELPFSNARTARLTGNHAVSGNPSRFTTGAVEIKSDDEWRSKQASVDRLVTTSLVFPMLRKYGYQMRVGGSVTSTESALQPIELSPLQGTPLVSVLINNYNYARFLPDALDSVLKQQYESFEVVVCDDGSTDDSCDIVKDYVRRDPRVRLVRKANGGQGSAFNAGFAACSGVILCFLDADDTFAEGKIERVVESLRGSTGLAIHQMMVVDGEGQELQRIPTFTHFESGWIAERVVRRGGRWRWMPTSAVALRREVMEHVWPVPEEAFRRDADMFILELAPLLTPVTGIEHILGYYRLHGSNSYSQRGIDESSTQRTLSTLSQALVEVNQRLESIRNSKIRLDPDDNIKIVEQRLLLESFQPDSSRRNLATQYMTLLRKVSRDDLYNRTQKMWSAILYGILLLLPRSLRPRWASANLGISHVKELARRIHQRDFKLR